MVKVQSIWDGPAVTVTEMKFALVAVADGCGRDTSSQGEYYFYTLVKTLPPKWQQGRSERSRGQCCAVHIQPSGGLQCELCHRLRLWGGWEAPAGQVSLSSHNFVGVWLLTGMRTWVRVVLLGCGNKKKRKRGGGECERSSAIS